MKSSSRYRTSWSSCTLSTGPFSSGRLTGATTLVTERSPNYLSCRNAIGNTGATAADIIRVSTGMRGAMTGTVIRAAMRGTMGTTAGGHLSTGRGTPPRTAKGGGVPGTGAMALWNSWPPPPSKNRKVDSGGNAMDEQAYGDMQVPTHMEAEDAGGGQAANMGEAHASRVQKEALDARIAEFRAAALEKGVDVADINFDASTLAQLEAIAATRLAAAADQ